METIQEQNSEQRPGTSVTVELDWNVLEPSIEVLPEVGMAGFAAWAEGAIYGVRFALEYSNALPCLARISAISGDVDSTNATVVAAAAAHAIWEAIAFEPSDELRARIENSVERSRGLGAGTIVSFGN